MKCLADGCYQYGGGAQHKEPMSLLLLHILLIMTINLVVMFLFDRSYYKGESDCVR